MQMVSLRVTTAILRITSLTLVLATVFAVAVAQDMSVRWGYRLVPINVIFVDNDYPADWSLDLEPILLKTGTESRDALLAGAIDVAELGVTPMLTALAQNAQDIVVIGVSSFGGGKYRVVVPPDSPVNTMDDLQGKKIAIKVGSGNYTAFLMWAEQQGYDIETDFKIVNMGDTDAMAALISGSVDAVAYWEPIPAILVAKGVAREIFDFDGYVYNPVYLVARRDWIAKHPNGAPQLLAAWMQAQAFVTFNAMEAATISAKVLGERGIDISADAYRLALGHETYETWFYPELLTETKSTFEFLKEQAIIPADATIDWGESFDVSYQTKAWDMLVNQALANQ